MSHPTLLIVPKVLNVAAGTVVLCLLLRRWLPLALRERDKADQRATDLETLAAIDFLTGVPATLRDARPCGTRPLSTLHTSR